MVSAIAKNEAVVPNCIYYVIKLILHRKTVHNFSFNSMKPIHSIFQKNKKLKPHINTRAALKFILQKPSNFGKHNLVSETQNWLEDIKVQFSNPFIKCAIFSYKLYCKTNTTMLFLQLNKRKTLACPFFIVEENLLNQESNDTSYFTTFTTSC